MLVIKWKYLKNGVIQDNIWNNFSTLLDKNKIYSIGFLHITDIVIGSVAWLRQFQMKVYVLNFSIQLHVDFYAGTVVTILTTSPHSLYFIRWHVKLRLLRNWILPNARSWRVSWSRLWNLTKPFISLQKSIQTFLAEWLSALETVTSTWVWRTKSRSTQTSSTSLFKILFNGFQ